MRCVIPAAGSGRRLSSHTEAKPLHPVCGVSLLERAMRAAHAGGATGFVVVTGFQGARVAAHAADIAARLGVPLECVHNPDWEDKANGASVLAARVALAADEPFLICMSDHLVAPDVFRRLLAAPRDDDAALLAVDRDLNATHVDPGDVTRVAVDATDGRLTGIGKRLPRFDGWDTGVFLATPALLDALEQEIREGRSALSDGVRRLAAQGGMRAVDVSGVKWFDCDTDEQVALAERHLFESLHKQRNRDGFIARWLNRPLSRALTRRLVALPVTPNQLSLVAFGLCALAALLFAAGPWWALALGGIVAQFASVLDGSDGEVARLKFQASEYGGWLDASLDRYADAVLLFGLTWHGWQHAGAPSVFMLGFAAVIGSFMVSYTADKHDAFLDRHRGAARVLRVGRDLRLFVIFLGALLHLPLFTLALLAVLMNGEAVRRLWLMKGAAHARPSCLRAG